MKIKLLLLPALIALLMGCGNDDKEISSPTTPPVNPPVEPPVNPPVKPPVTEGNGDLLSPGATGKLSALGGATRLKAERTEALKASLSNRQVKNIILFIGDGTSESEISIARNYAEGASGYLKGLDVFPFTGAYSTYSLMQNSEEINYVPDSAATATAWATGVKTYNGALGIDTFGKAHDSILKMAKKAGFATGNVTTTELQDATPAALVSSVSGRKCYGPSATSKSCPSNALENSGQGSITEQLLMTRADVTLGGGSATFDEKALAGAYKGKTLWEQAQALKYQMPNDLASLKAIKVADQNQPVLGLFARGNLPVSLIGPSSVLDGNKKPATTCADNPLRLDSIPTLPDMTAKAIDLLKVNKKGFFLQVESGSIDKQNHSANACGQIGETIALDQAIQVALEFAKTNPDTLIIVTGDHAHTSQIISNTASSPGKSVSLFTKDNTKMSINYATAKGSQGHTGAQVRTAAYGPHAANISGLLDQTDLFFIMRNAMGIK
ncbi:alkaline phosphatase [Acinetobacter calcoaceticus]|uniref:Alkaline phosphatase n=1 Tax=Acinetobacter calcoaceticus TaxID=471 RepID=A0A4R1XXZ2_ACICA|nr:alkaline phosphatase [Acinetobacter calcoaceticus]